MLTAALLTLIGTADLARTHLGRRAAIVAVVGVWAAVVVAATAGLGAGSVGVAAVVVLAGAWLPLTTTAEGRRPPFGLRPALGVVLGVAVLTLVDRAGDLPAGPLVTGYAELGRGGAVPPLEQALLLVASALFLVESGNVVVRAALFRELPQPDAPASRRGLSLRARLSRERAQEVRLPDLLGGRAIGPLERLLVAGLTLTGAIGLAGAVFAAKGIVRFPEISRDGEGGSKAEYFLVGSLVSWTLALGCAGLVALAGA